MKSKSRAILSSTAIVTVALAIVIGALIYKERRGLKRVKNRMDVLSVQLESAYQRNPFPYPSNVVSVAANVEQVEQELTRLMTEMSKGQIEPDTNSVPLAWLALRDDIFRSLRDRAKAGQVDLRPDFNFGFEKYAGTAPFGNYVGRLSAQLRMLERICALLFENGISDLTLVRRTVFEDSAAAMAVAPGLGETEGSGDERVRKDGLYEKEHFRFDFRAKEMNLISIMNALAANDMFMVVTSLKVDGVAAFSPDLGRKRDSSSDKSPDGFSEPVEERVDSRPREERIVTGRGLEKHAAVSLELDVYSFEHSGARRPKK